MIRVTFEHSNDDYPQVTEGPFEWVEMIGGNMFGLRPGTEEAEEIAGVNEDGTWDAGPIGILPDSAERINETITTVRRKRRAYTRWTISEAARGL